MSWGKALMWGTVIVAVLLGVVAAAYFFSDDPVGADCAPPVRPMFGMHLLHRTNAHTGRADDPVALLRSIPCRHPAQGHRDSYFVLASSRITNRSPLQSSTAKRSTRRWAFSIASASSVQTIGSRLTKCPS